MEFKQLTVDEIASLQVDAALRILAGNTSHLISINKDISKAIIELGRAKIALDCLKNDKGTLVEINRALKSVVSNG